jgi:hypothetical protein
MQSAPRPGRIRMAKYRKKPVVIDAVRWYGKLTDETEWPDWFRTALNDSEANPTLYPDALTMHPQQVLCVATLEGTMRANPGDWIIRGVKGEIYPCKPEIFEATYEDA